MSIKQHQFGLQPRMFGFTITTIWYYTKWYDNFKTLALDKFKKVHGITHTLFKFDEIDHEIFRLLLCIKNDLRFVSQMFLYKS